MADAKARRAMLEAKRKRLRELRQLTAQRAQASAAPPAPSPAPAPEAPAAAPVAATPQPAPANNGGAGFDAYLDSLLNSGPGATAPSTSIGSVGEASGADKAPAGNQAPEASAESVEAALRRQLASKFQALSMQSGVVQVSIMSPPVETFTVKCQTDPWVPPQPEPVAVAPAAKGDAGADDVGAGGEPSSEAKGAAVPGAGAGAGAGAGSSNNNDDEQDSTPAAEELTQEEVDRQVKSEPFKSFLGRASTVLERALGQASSFDIMVDYGAEDVKTRTTAEELATLAEFSSEELCHGRAVTDLSWSPHHPELLLTSYDRGSSRMRLQETSSEGLALVWSLLRETAPEYTFTCQTAVLAASFHTFDPYLVLGGTYSGQMVLWDYRAKHSPVQQTPLSATGHTHPVYSMAVVGATNAHSLVSVSTDGRMCLWNMSKLVEPVWSVVLKPPPVRDVVSRVPVTALSFPGGEQRFSAVGCENGALGVCQLHDSERGAVSLYRGPGVHEGPVTSLNFHPSMSRLLLSTSVDWSVKLWSQSPSHGTSAASLSPLASFQTTDDYMFDAQWCPTHPATFATAAGTGQVDVWNLNENTEEPVLGVKASEHAVNKVRWSHDARKLATGDSGGHVKVLDVGAERVAARPIDWEMFETVVDGMRDAS